MLSSFQRITSSLSYFAVFPSPSATANFKTKLRITMDLTTPNPTNTCVQCQRSATLRWISCKDAPGSDETTKSTYYCTSECQKADWKKHKTSCKRLETQKALYSVSWPLQEVFYLYREKVFNKLIAKIETKNRRCTYMRADTNRI